MTPNPEQVRKGRGQLSQLETDLVEANDPKKQKYQVQPLTTPYDPLRPLTTPYDPLRPLTTPCDPLRPLTTPCDPV